MKVLVINCGSSSLKYQLIDMATEESLAQGLVERIGIEGSVLTQKVEGKDKYIVKEQMKDHKDAIRLVLAALVDENNGVIKSMDEISAVGHRVVHGGEKYKESVVINDEVKANIEECFKLAPLHNPANMIGIKACEELLPNTPMVAVFDTAFHGTMPEDAYLYALPYELYEKHGIRKYGFHGTSHKYVSQTCAEVMGRDIKDLKIITCHLGNGCSLAAVKGGKSIDTSMGFTPLAGIMMGTRAGSIDPSVISFLIEEKGYTVPTPIQEKAIPVALAKKDILGCAQTGTGKTASFAIPIIQHLHLNKGEGKRSGIKALILTPTRELALQISECIEDYSKYTRIRHGVIFGGVNQRPQVDMLHKGIDILVATPGRLLDLMNQGHIRLDNIQYFVLDEADRMLDMGFIHDIKRILPKLPKEKQTLFFSATMPDTIIALTNSLLKNPLKIYVTPKSSTVDSIKQLVYFVEKKEKSLLLISILQKSEDRSVLIFSRTKHNADKIVKILGKAGIGSQAIHGNKSQAARQSALGNFKSGKTRVMVATDIASRGIDINELPLVINYDLPDVPETYVHRIGRTGRAGNAGMALTFCSQEERKQINDIQKLTGKKLNRADFTI